MEDIIWKVKLKSSPSEVFSYLNTNQGRAAFWAEEANEIDGKIHFKFINGQTYNGSIITRVRDKLFQVDYFQSSVTIHLHPDTDDGGTIITLENRGVKEEEYPEVKSGWVSVLLNMKSVIDHQVDLRNHHQQKCWDQGYIGN